MSYGSWSVGQSEYCNFDGKGFVIRTGLIGCDLSFSELVLNSRTLHPFAGQSAHIGFYSIKVTPGLVSCLKL